MNFIDNQIIMIGYYEYKYSEYYKLLRLINNSSTDNIPSVICPICLNDKFIITYGVYECIAICKCGHKMTVYDG